MKYDHIALHRNKAAEGDDVDPDDLGYTACAHPKNDEMLDDPLWSAQVSDVRLAGSDLSGFRTLKVQMRPWHEVGFTGTTNGLRMEINDTRSD